MSDGQSKADEPSTITADDEHELDRIVKHYGVTREEARRLIKEYGDKRRELEAAAGQIAAKRVL